MIIDLNREPTIQELSDRTGLTPEDIAAAESATSCTESISREIGAEGFTLENILTDTDSEEKMLERIALNQAIEKLSERERLVIKLRYFHGLTQDRVSKVLNVSQVQVSRIEKRAIANLKEFMS
jgi:RNA polymerase sporulation-specific sigma factor